MRRALALLALTTALHAQEWHHRERTDRAPVSCARADSLIGPMMEWERLVESRDALSDSAIVSSRTWKRSGMAIGTRFEGDARAYREGRGPYGFVGLLFTVQSDGPPLTSLAFGTASGVPVIAGAAIGTDLGAQSTPIAGASTARIVADSVRLAAPVFYAGSKPGGIGLFRWDALLVPLTPAQLAHLARAQSVRWRIAALEGELPSEGRMRMIAIAREAMCTSPARGDSATR
jgi:hypothetical protein